MRLTTRATHAINAMVDLAVRQQQGPVRLADVADREGISHSYLELLFGQLRRSRLVDGIRGPGGGYRLAKPMSAISMADIVDAVDASGIGVKPVGRAQNPEIDPPPSALDAMWAGLAKAMREHMQSVTIADIVGGEELVAEAPAAVAVRPAVPVPPELTVPQRSPAWLAA